jgi:hypothetical protein
MPKPTMQPGDEEVNALTRMLGVVGGAMDGVGDSLETIANAITDLASSIEALTDALRTKSEKPAE